MWCTERAPLTRFSHRRAFPLPGSSRIRFLRAVAAVAMLGAAIVADNGAASDKNTNRMEACGFSYLTRVSVNALDLKNIEAHCSESE